MWDCRQIRVVWGQILRPFECSQSQIALRCDFIRLPYRPRPWVRGSGGPAQDSCTRPFVLFILSYKARATYEGVPRRWGGLMGATARPTADAETGAEPRADAPVGSAG